MGAHCSVPYVGTSSVFRFRVWGVFWVCIPPCQEKEKKKMASNMHKNGRILNILLAEPIDTVINFSPLYITSPTSTHLTRWSISTHLIDIYQGRIENQEFGLISLHLRWKLDIAKIRQIIIRKFKVYCFSVSYYNSSESKVRMKTLHWFFAIDFVPSYIDI